MQCWWCSRGDIEAIAFGFLCQAGFTQCNRFPVQLLRSSPWETRVEYKLTNLETQQSRSWYALLTMENAKRTFHNPFGLLVTGVRISTTVS